MLEEAQGRRGGSLLYHYGPSKSTSFTFIRVFPAERRQVLLRVCTVSIFMAIRWGIDEGGLVIVTSFWLNISSYNPLSLDS